jgi:phosphatidate cytidylyltransferase
MGLDIRKFGIRTGSAIVFAVLLLGALLWNYYSFTLFFFVVSIGSLAEFYSLSQKAGSRPFFTIGIITACALYIASFLSQFHGTYVYLMSVASVTPAIILAAGLLSKNDNPLAAAMFTIAGIFYAVLPFIAMHAIVMYHHVYSPALVLGVILLIWSNDTFAYLGGSFFGKHKMIERISPGKTWEGTIIGVALTILIAIPLNSFLLDGKGGVTWYIIACIVPVLATIGDLVESRMKRVAGVKDSGQIMPGHGGFLDRFDSLIFTLPFIYCVILLL